MSIYPSAFPVNTGNSQESGAFYPETGMTIRDWLAGQRLANISQHYSPEMAAKEAYRFADAMLEERAKK